MMKDMIPKLVHFFQNEAERFGVRAVFLYGSFARGFPRQDSDLDVAIVFDDDSDEDIIYRRLVDISLLLSERSGRDVKVIPIYWELPFAACCAAVTSSVLPVWAIRFHGTRIRKPPPNSCIGGGRLHCPHNRVYQLYPKSC